MTTRTQTMEQSLYRSTGVESGAGPSTIAMGETMSASAAFGVASAAAARAVEVPLARLSYEGSRDERIISGSNRYKYFRRPIIPFLNAQPPEVLFAPADADPEGAAELPVPEPEPAFKEVGVQSVYRESAAQTTPYTPEYVLQPGAPEPEVLGLAALKHGAGLPVGLYEVQMIERARAKREFEASLPPMTDEVSLALRRKMMGEQELRDWNVREEQIKEVQEEKLAHFDARLRERCEERELRWDERIEHMRQIKLTEKDREISQIQRRRIKALRKLSEARKNIDPASVEPRDVVAEYAEYGSEVYAPLTRNGLITRDKMAHQYETKPAQLESLEGLQSLEASIPAKLLEPTLLAKPGKVKLGGFKQRRDRRMVEQLERTDATLKAAKQARPSEKEQREALLSAYRDTKPVERPPTPSVMPPEHEESLEMASVLLQRLLRGRAIQNMMYEGKERRLELIRELRVEDVEDHELDALDLHEAEAEVGLATVVDSVQAELVGTSLDRMSKELRRFTEERRVAEIVREAERTRRVREAEESGRRLKEMKLRSEQQEAYRQLYACHRSSASSFIDDVLADVAQSAAQAQAEEEAALKESRINGLVDKLEERHAQMGSIASDLVHNFLLPEVQRQTERRRDALEGQKFSNASRRALGAAVDRVEASMAEL